jgi:hypothetical protein
MTKNFSIEADNRLGDQEIPPPFRNPKNHYRDQKKPPACPPPVKWIKSISSYSIWDPLYKCPLNYPYVIFSFEVLRSNYLYAFSSLSCLIHTNRISPVFINKSKNICWRIQIMKLLIMQNFFSLQLLLPFVVQIFTSASCCHTPWVQVLN